MRIPSDIEIRTIAHHAIRQLMIAEGRDPVEFTPGDMLRQTWIEQCLTNTTVEDQYATVLEAGEVPRGDWKVPAQSVVKVVADAPIVREDGGIAAARDEIMRKQKTKLQAAMEAVGGVEAEKVS